MRNNKIKKTSSNCKGFSVKNVIINIVVVVGGGVVVLMIVIVIIQVHIDACDAPATTHRHKLRQHRPQIAKTCNLSPPRAQPAHSTSTNTGAQHQQPVSKTRTGNSLLFEIRTP